MNRVYGQFYASRAKKKHKIVRSLYEIWLGYESNAKMSCNGNAKHTQNNINIYFLESIKEEKNTNIIKNSIELRKKSSLF